MNTSQDTLHLNTPKATPLANKGSILPNLEELALMTEVTTPSIKAYKIDVQLTGIHDYMYWASKLTDLFRVLDQWDPTTSSPKDTPTNAYAITCNVNRDCYDLIRDCSSASIQWQTLKVRFGGVSVAMQIKVIKQLSAFTYGADAVGSFNTMKELNRNLKAASGVSSEYIFYDKLCVWIMINSLPTVYAPLRFNVEKQLELHGISLTELELMVFNEERKDTNEVDTHALFNSNQKPKSRPSNGQQVSQTLCTAHVRAASTCWKCQPSLQPS